MSELAKLGIEVARTHQTTGEVATTTLTLTLPRPVTIKATFTPESMAKMVIKLFKKEVQTGDPLFDSEIYISTDTPEEIKAFLDEDVRNAIGFIVTNGGPLEIYDTTLSIIVGGDEPGETNEMLTIARALLATG
ncbi:MAG: hypothetical protein ABI591_18575 [Kofleriaceae bacterium]